MIDLDRELHNRLRALLDKTESMKDMFAGLDADLAWQVWNVSFDWEPEPFATQEETDD